MNDLGTVFSRLARSSFRSRFRLNAKDEAYLRERGIETVLVHAADFVGKRLAPAAPANDSKQTPMRGHPVFVAQHATATCCRRCLSKWHAIPAGQELSVQQQTYIAAVIGHWLRSKYGTFQ